MNAFQGKDIWIKQLTATPGIWMVNSSKKLPLPSSVHVDFSLGFIHNSMFLVIFHVIHSADVDWAPAVF